MKLSSFPSIDQLGDGFRDAGFCHLINSSRAVYPRRRRSTSGCLATKSL